MKIALFEDANISKARMYIINDMSLAHKRTHYHLLDILTERSMTEV